MTPDICCKAKPNQSLLSHSKDTLKILDFLIQETEETIKDFCASHDLEYEKTIAATRFSSLLHDMGKSKKKWQQSLPWDRQKSRKQEHALSSFSIVFESLKSCNRLLSIPVENLREDIYAISSLLAILSHHDILHEGIFHDNSRYMEEAYEKNCQASVFELADLKCSFELLDLKKHIKLLDQLKNQLSKQKQKVSERAKIIKMRTLYSLILNLMTFSDGMASKACQQHEDNSSGEDRAFIDEKYCQEIRDCGYLFSKQEMLSSLQPNSLIKSNQYLNEIQNQAVSKTATKYILTADCGIGKTLAGLLCAKNIMDRGHQDRIIFTLPTKMTSNSMYKSFNANYNIPEKYLGIYHSDVIEVLRGLKNEENSVNDLKFASMLYNRAITVSTIDHLILSLVNGYKYAPRAFHSVQRSVVVFDEFHYYDNTTLKSIFQAIEILDKLKIPHIIISATLPESIKNKLKGYEHIKDKSKNTMSNSRYSINKVDEEISPEDIKEKIDCCQAKKESLKAIVYVNQVEKSKRIYRGLKELFGEKKIILYHSQFIRRDRIDKEKKIIESFDKEESVILIATQVAELSLDISSDIMFSDIAPIDSILQRAGRIHRKGNSSKSSDCKCLQCESAETGSHSYNLFVYNLKDKKEKLPYYDAKEDEEDILDSTWEVLQNSEVTPEKSEQWLNQVYNKTPDLVSNEITNAFYDDLFFGKKPEIRYGKDEDSNTGKVKIREKKFLDFSVIPIRFEPDMQADKPEENAKYFVKIPQGKYWKCCKMGKISEGFGYLKFISVDYDSEMGLDFDNFDKKLDNVI